MKRGPSGLLKLYLITYNFVSLAGWAYVLFLAIAKIAATGTYENVFEVTWPTLIIVQSTALFEVISTRNSNWNFFIDNISF